MKDISLYLQAVAIDIFYGLSHMCYQMRLLRNSVPLLHIQLISRLYDDYIYIYIYVCVYIYMCVYIYVYIYICVCVCIYIYIYIYCVCVSKYYLPVTCNKQWCVIVT